MRQMDGYIRVSRVGGRQGESFISPDEQRATIEAWARSTKTEIIAWHEDLDQSGGTHDRPGFNTALERCRSGLTGGIVGARLDRLSRTGVVGVASLLEDAARHGYNVVAVDLGVDLHSPNGKLVANLIGSVAQWERERRRDEWAVAQRNAVERGVPNGRAPIGFRKRPDGRFEIEKAEAAKVHEAFELRAAGESFSAIGRRYGWSHSTTRQVLGNVAYLGVARSGAHVNEHAHPPIVTRELFEAANAARTKQPVPPGETTKDRVLRGLARCAGCGRTLKVVRRPRADGSYVPAYFCKNAASEPCQDRAYVHADELDAFVEAWFTEALRSAPRMIDVVAQARELEEAQAEQETAEAELYAYVETASTLDAGAWQACEGQTHFERGERIWIGADLGGGERSTSAVLYLNEGLHVGCEVFTGDSSATNAAEFIAELAETYTVVEAAYDPWQGALLAETMEQRGLTAVQFPQGDSRMQPASERLHRAIIEQRIVHDGNAELAAHVHAAVAKQTRRGWRLHRPGSEPIDAAVALAIALDRAEHRAEPVKLLGWL